MQLVVICTGLACGALLAATGLVLWDGFRQVSGLSQAVRLIGWVAGGLLLVGGLVAWQVVPDLSASALRPLLMAALAAPPQTHRRSSWADVMLTLPALILGGLGLFRLSAPIGNEIGADAGGFALLELAVAVCGGLGARALGEGLREIAVSASSIEWQSAATYVSLTLLVGGAALVNLWRRGRVWAGTASERGLAGIWLAWNAARLGPREHPRLRAGLTVVAALLLIVVALGPVGA